MDASQPLLPMREAPQPPQRGWRAFAAAHWPAYLAVALLCVAMRAVDPIEPRPRAIYHKSDAELWQYSYPLQPDTVPLWVVPLLNLALPLLVFAGAWLAGMQTGAEAHAAGVNLLACVFASGLVANLLKSQVARPRPDFVHRCWPTSLEPVFSPAGLALCEAGVPHQTIKTGMRSFPSVHAAWCGAGQGFLCLWLLGMLRCLAAGRAAPHRLAVALLPLCAAGWVGVTRVANNRHHPSDVLAGYLLGGTLALAFYLQVFASPLSPRSGCLAAEGDAGGARNGGGGDSEPVQQRFPPLG